MKGNKGVYDQNQTKFFWNNWHWGTENLLGVGGYAKVYKAEKKIDGNTIYSAIKIITIPKNANEIISDYQSGKSLNQIQKIINNKKDKYLNEIKMLYDLRGNANIVNIEQYDIKETTYEITIRNNKHKLIGYQLMIQMEYLESFAEYIRNNRLTKEEILEFAIDICKALKLCMEKNIIHRDIKPSNIMIKKIGNHNCYKLIDFGVGKYIENDLAGSLVGTDYYMAPEIGIPGQKYGFTVDYYALGLILYQLMNENRLPFVSSKTNHQDAIRKRNKSKVFLNPVMDWPEMFEIIKKCCAFKSEERYQTAIDLEEDFKKLQNKILLKKSPVNVHNPIIEYSEEYERELVTWDCIYYHAWPQKLLKKSQESFISLIEDEWNEEGEKYIHGEKYKKIIDKNGKIEIFRYEPILWRVLQVEKNRVLLLSDSIILHGNYGSVLPNDTFFLLDEDALTKREYGFKPDIELADEARSGQYTDFLLMSENGGYNSWWIKSNDKDTAKQIIPSGQSSGFGFSKEEKAGIRPAMYLPVKKINSENYAGTKTVKRRVW